METGVRYCSIDTQTVLHDIVGSIEHRPHQLFLEVAEPWDRTFSLSQHFPPHLAIVLKTFAKKGVYITTSLFAPDEKYSKAGFSRFIYMRANSDQLRYDTFEFLLPIEGISASIETILSAKDPYRSEMQKYRVHSNTVRDYFICTHFHRDRCCGVFGQALYDKLQRDPLIRKQAIRLFRCSHIGGHRYAPTLLESPTLGCWGLLNEDLARKIMTRDKDIETVIDHYRGSALYTSPFHQVAERELLRRTGWEWYDAEQRSITGDIDKDHGRITIGFASQGASVKKQYLVETHTAEPIHLRPNCTDSDAHAFPQYRIKSVEAV